jgi:hypothetical protein
MARVLLVEGKVAVLSRKLSPRLHFRRLPGLPGGRRRLLLALLAIELVLLVSLVATAIVKARGNGDEFVARETLLAQSDLPSGWVPVEAAAYPYMTNSPLIRLLLEEDTVAGAFSAYRDPEDSSAVATYVVFRPDNPLSLQAGDDDRTLETMTPLVMELERLARQRLDGALPELFFATTDVPVPGSLRGRSLAPPTGEGVQSDSILFATGPVLALVVVENPRDSEPFRPVEELAQTVYSRILEQLD